MGSKEGPRHMNKPSKNKPKSQVAVAPPAITSHLPLSEALALATVDEMAADAVAYAQSVVDDAKLEADLRVGGSFDAFEPDGPPAYVPTWERVGGSADRVEVEDVGSQDLREALVANAQEECTGFTDPTPPQAEVAKRAPTFFVVDPAQLVALGWSEHSAGKIALAVHKAQEAYARLEGHGSYIPAPRLTGLALRASPASNGTGQGTAGASKPSGAAVGVSLPSGVTANGQIYTAAARGNAISIYDEATRKVNGEKFAYSDAGWAAFNEWLQAKRAAGARVQLKFFSDAQRARITPPAEATTPPAEATTPPQE
jgi:hypothetical protein